jgi:hypothetical protein
VVIDDDLLGRPGLPDALHWQIEDYAPILRGRRTQWTAELTLASSTIQVRWRKK